MIWIIIGSYIIGAWLFSAIYPFVTDESEDATIERSIIWPAFVIGAIWWSVMMSAIIAAEKIYEITKEDK